ncbi:MAG TPA: hypothetical protein DCG34_05305 [Clostridiales bacterium]|jgi:hypothetical protein|nr:hypothetical protein [Clostridiales bacterium]
MLVTRKINVLSFIIGRPQAASSVKAHSVSKAQNLNDTNIENLDNRITITKSEDFYKAHNTSLFNPLNKLNR